jgi:hypothetical protein
MIKKAKKTVLNLLLDLLRYIYIFNFISMEPKVNLNNFTPDCGQVWYLKAVRGNN